MRNFIFLGSEEWEMEQEYKQSQGEERSYRVLELHLGNQVNQFTASLNNLIQNPCLALPAQARTAFMRCLMFRVLCRAGAAVQQLLTVGHRAAPFPLFGALWGMLTSLDELPPCQRDELITLFKGTFPGDAILSAEAQQILHACVTWQSLAASLV